MTMSSAFYRERKRSFTSKKQHLSRNFDRLKELTVAKSGMKGGKFLNIGKQLKDARIESGYTQEQVAEQLDVSRQTISSWENGRTFPDIVSVVSLSDIYDVSLDALIKGDEKMLEHLEESTNIVKSNKKLLFAIIANILTAIAMIGLSVIIPSNEYVLAGVFCVMVIAASFLMHQIVKRI